MKLLRSLLTASSFSCKRTIWDNSLKFARNISQHSSIKSPPAVTAEQQPQPMEEVLEGKDFNFPREEKKILELWKGLDAFKEQLRLTEGKPEYIFYDGPPFATGLPHYGHILAGTIKVRPMLVLLCCVCP